MCVWCVSRTVICLILVTGIALRVYPWVPGRMRRALTRESDAPCVANSDQELHSFRGCRGYGDSIKFYKASVRALQKLSLSHLPGLSTTWLNFLWALPLESCHSLSWELPTLSYDYFIDNHFPHPDSVLRLMWLKSLNCISIFGAICHSDCYQHFPRQWMISLQAVVGSNNAS